MDRIEYGICDVSIPHKKHRAGEVRRPKWWRLEFKENPQKHIVIIETTPLKIEDFANLLHGRVTSSEDDDMFIFVHGYNVTFEDAARRTAQISFDLNFRGAAVMYSWASNGKLLDYKGDIENIKLTESLLKEFLCNIVHWSKTKNIHIIAHSMGTCALTRAIIEAEESLKTRAAFNNIILAAPDIKQQIFIDDIAPKLIPSPIKNRLTLYASSNDKALKASRNIRLTDDPRLGEGGRKKIFVMDGMDSIDASKVRTDLLGHGYFSNTKTLIDDIFYMTKNNLSPDRRNLRSRIKNGIRYWLLPRN